MFAKNSFKNDICFWIKVLLHGLVFLYWPFDWAIIPEHMVFLPFFYLNQLPFVFLFLDYQIVFNGFDPIGLRGNKCCHVTLAYGLYKTSQANVVILHLNLN